jgi:hypothetical protein
MLAPLPQAYYPHLQNARTLQKPIQLPLLRLQVAISPNMLLINENIRHAALSRDLLQRILQRGAILHLIQLHQEIFVWAAELVVQEGLGGAAVGAVGFAEDDDGVVVDDGLGFGFGGRHGGGGGACEGCEEAADEGSYGCGSYRCRLRGGLLYRWVREQLRDVFYRSDGGD